MSAIRLRRLSADAARLRDYVRRHPRVRLVQEAGDPPESYQLEYKVKSLRKGADGVEPADTHLVEITLPRNYPRTPPQCRMLSPVFHPNIAPHAICVGDHWSAGESLQSIVTRIGEILGYQSYNVKSPLNGEAAKWVDENAARLPLDAVSMVAEEDGEEPAAVVAPPLKPPPAAPKPAPPPPQPHAAAVGPDRVVISCTHCEASFRVPADKGAGRARCKSCGEVFAFDTAAA